MKATLLLFATSAAVLAAGQADEAALKKEKALIEGTWKIMRLTTPKGDQDNVAGATLTFGKDGSVEFRKGDETKKATFKLNPAAKPKEIDLTPDDDANKVMRGIYQIEKDMLKLCLDHNPNSGQRPNEFTAPEGGSNVLITLEKMK
jgi:uncharacterized protein (TIGR03067 family)